MHLFGKNLVLSTKCQADLWPFIQGHSFGLPHTYLNICFSEITGLFDWLFKSLDQNVCNPHIWWNIICSIISCSWPWPILTLLRRSGERLRTFRSSSLEINLLKISFYSGIILGQKSNAAYKTYIVYGGYFTNLLQTICHSLSADSWNMSSCDCPGYHCHRATFIQEFKTTFLLILTSRH